MFVFSKVLPQNKGYDVEKLRLSLDSFFEKRINANQGRMAANHE